VSKGLGYPRSDAAANAARREGSRPVTGIGHRGSIILVGLFALLAYFPLFLNLDVLPLRVWDEARTAVSAYEMAESGNFLVPHYEGEPDMWGVKPPLPIWAQVLFMHLLGTGELAVRLPSAMAALLAGWLLFHHCWRRMELPWIGLFTVAGMYSSAGLINMHAARSGDHDALLILFMVAALLAMHRWCGTGARRELLAFFVFLALAVLSKSVQALLFLPGLALYVLYRKRMKDLLTSRWTWLGSGLFILLVGAYYLGREAVNPGYLEAVWQNELWGRFGSTREGHSAPWDHYILLLMDRYAPHLYLWALVGIPLGLAATDARMRHWTALLACTALSYLLVISLSATKLDWYGAPLIPFTAGLAAVAFHSLLLLAISLVERVKLLRTTSILPYLFLFVIFARPWSTIVQWNYDARELPHEEEFYTLSHLMKRAARTPAGFEATKLVYDEHHAHLLFYVHQLRDQGHPLQMATVDEVAPGDVVLCDQYHIRHHMETHFDHQVLHAEAGVRMYRILGEERQPQETSPE
jgi:hypothetical protein